MAESQATSQKYASARPVVIDADPGTDDAQAIGMMLSADGRGEIRLLGLTITFGNSTVKQCTRNARRILSVFHRLDIPIYSGAHCGLVNGVLEITGTDQFHGENGMGDVQFEQPLPKVPRQTEHAATALVRLAREHKGELTILAVGPLTNIALATRMDPDFLNNVKDIFIMGGNSTGLGNTTVAGEFNFHSDPEAAYIVISSTPRPVTIITWEICLQYKLDMSWRTQVLGAADSEAARLFNASEAKLLLDDDFDGWITCDQAAAAVLIRPQVALKTSTHHATVELHGQFTRGQMVVDRRGWCAAGNAHRCNVHIVETLDLDLYKNMLLDGFGHPDIKF